MRRTVALLLSAVMAVSLTGCNVKNEPAQSNSTTTDSAQKDTKKDTKAGETTTAEGKKEPITLKLWAGIQPEYGYDELVRNFNEEFADKGIQLEYTRYVNNDDGNLQLDTYLLGGDDVDVFIGYGGLSRLKKRADANLLLDMTPYLEARNFDAAKELGESNVGGYLLDGKNYGLPTKYENVNWILANVNLFKEAGIELPVDGWTYSQFLEVLPKLTKGEGPDKVYGIFWWLVGGGTTGGMGNLGAVPGKYKTYADDSCKETSFDNPVYEEGLQLMLDTMDQGWAPSYADEKSDNLSFANVYLEGKAAMSFGISQLRIVKDLETYPHDFETALIPFPVPDESFMDQADYSGIAGAGDVICVNSKTKYVDEAMDFVIWYIEGGMAPLAKGGRIPLWKDFNSDLIVEALNEKPGIFEENSLRKYLSIDATNAYESLETGHTAEIGDIKKEGIESVLLGQKTPKEALQDMKTRSDALLSN